MSTGTTNSMSLLTGLLESPLDAGYAEAAARRAERAAASPDGQLPERRSSWLSAIGLLLIAVVLVVAAVQTHKQLPSAEKDRARLVQQVQEREQLSARLQRQARSLRTEVTDLRSRELALSGEGQALANEVSTLEAAAGASPLTGPGITVTVADAPNATTSADGNPRTNANDASRVTDRDLQRVVNGLWAAGAEAVAINGYRLSNLSTIRSAGEAVLVDFHPLASPYAITAIGPQAALQHAVTAGPAGRYLAGLGSDYGITTDVALHKSVTVPAANLGSVRVAQLAPGATIPGVPTSGPTSSVTSSTTLSSTPPSPAAVSSSSSPAAVSSSSSPAAASSTSQGASR